MGDSIPPPTGEPRLEDLVRELAPGLIRDPELQNYLTNEGCGAVVEAVRTLLRHNDTLPQSEAVTIELKKQNKTGKQTMLLAGYVAYMKSLGKGEKDIYNPRDQSAQINTGIVTSRWASIKKDSLFVGSIVIYKGSRYKVVDILKDAKLSLVPVSGKGKKEAVVPNKVRKVE